MTGTKHFRLKSFSWVTFSYEKEKKMIRSGKTAVCFFHLCDRQSLNYFSSNPQEKEKEKY